MARLTLWILQGLSAFKFNNISLARMAHMIHAHLSAKPNKKTANLKKLYNSYLQQH